MKNSAIDTSVIDQVIAELEEHVSAGAQTETDEELEFVQRQLGLIKRARAQDVAMAEKIAEGFGYRATKMSLAS
ncbi:hypothetical protein OU790_18505 [Ruegeria sp. NA]|nr:hypothetical protein [Ruegeria sp. NA]MCX8955415.1 hypothetical protein [Ruegeria sp. NA]